MASRRLRTPHDLGAAIRDARITQSLTQAHLARDAGVSREWLIGIEQGNRPRAELSKIFSVLEALGLPLFAESPAEPHDPRSRPVGPRPRETTTAMATRKAIESFRPPTQVPAVAEHGRRASRLLNAGLDPALVSQLTQLSIDLLPPEAPGDSKDDEELQSP